MAINTAPLASGIRANLLTGKYREERFDNLLNLLCSFCHSVKDGEDILTQGGAYDHEAHAWAIALRNEAARECRVRGFSVVYDSESGQPTVTAIAG